LNSLPVRWPTVILTSCLIIAPTVATAADCDDIGNPYVHKEFVILKTTPSFKEATQSATTAAAALGIELKLRGLSPNLRIGLTSSKEECARNELRYPCYVPRGRADDGTYVSVEWSSQYDLFAKGLYVVMIASGLPGSRTTRNALDAARRLYPHAYTKRVKVYVGCRR
jgi:hypothetical protein